MKKGLLICSVLLTFFGLNAGAESFIKSITTSRGPSGGSSHPSWYDQTNQPFAAFGNLVYSGADYYYTSPSGATEVIGGLENTYDANGRLILSEGTVINKDGVYNKTNSWNDTIVPVGAVVKMLTQRDGDSELNTIYYLDPVTGEEKYLNYRKVVYYDGEQVVYINRDMDEYGNLVEYGRRIESEFDTQGRPTQTIAWSQTTLFDKNTGKESYVYIPYEKVDYEYGSGTLVTKTVSSNWNKTPGTPKWVYSRRFTTGEDASGAECYEDYWFSSSDTVWYGNDKYSILYKETASGSEKTEIRWYWDYGTQEWTISSKLFSKSNSKGRKVYEEYYYYDSGLATFVMYQQNGFEFQGDTLQCADWQISYTSDTLGNTSVSYGYRTTYEDYTCKELGLPESYAEYNYLPRKTETYYNLDVNSSETTKWIPYEKAAYEYALSSPWGTEGSQLNRTGVTRYKWENDLCYIYEKETHKYNSYNDEILSERESYGQMVERSEYEYEYRTVQSQDGYSYIDRNTLREAEWRRVNDTTFAITSLNEYAYDKENRRILDAYRSDWDVYYNTWSNGYKNEWVYDDDNYASSTASYDWNAYRAEWIGQSKDSTISCASGDTTYHYSYYGSLDSMNNFVWIPASYSAKIRTEWNGVVNELTENYNEWVSYSDSWIYGEKYEYSYVVDTLGGIMRVLLDANYYLENGEWKAYYRNEYVYNDEGQIIQSKNGEYQRTDYTYLESGQLKDTYSYRYQGNDWVLYEKYVGIVEGGRVVAYYDSVFASYSDSWVVQSRQLVAYDDSTGKVTRTYADWDYYDSVWNNSRQEIELLDAQGRTIYSEEYYWEPGDQPGYGYWSGSTKSEYAFGPNGNQVMFASYYWDGSEWVGDDKYEEDYDPFTGYQTLQASYNWDYQRKAWRGNYFKYEYAYDRNGNQTLDASYYWDNENWTWSPNKKEEREYDEDGNETMSAYYYGSKENPGEWVGQSKSGWYQKGEISYSESYTWDKEKKDWRGAHKQEMNYSDGSMARYEWDDDAWCWVGVEKTVYDKSDENGYGVIYYAWDRTNNQWVLSSKTWYEYDETDTYSKETVTESKWSVSGSSWVPESRSTEMESWRSDGNLDYRLVSGEFYNGSDWALDFSGKTAMKYTVRDETGVYDISAQKNDVIISLNDGNIYVTAQEDSFIYVIASSGSYVASGIGSVSVAVTSGTYLINVDGKTSKVVVR